MNLSNFRDNSPMGATNIISQGNCSEIPSWRYPVPSSSQNNFINNDSRAFCLNNNIHSVSSVHQMMFKQLQQNQPPKVLSHNKTQGKEFEFSGIQAKQPLDASHVLPPLQYPPPPPPPTTTTATTTTATTTTTTTAAAAASAAATTTITAATSSQPNDNQPFRQNHYVQHHPKNGFTTAKSPQGDVAIIPGMFYVKMTQRKKNQNSCTPKNELFSACQNKTQIDTFSTQTGTLSHWTASPGLYPKSEGLDKPTAQGLWQVSPPRYKTNLATQHFPTIGTINNSQSFPGGPDFYPQIPTVYSADHGSPKDFVPHLQKDPEIKLSYTGIAANVAAPGKSGYSSTLLPYGRGASFISSFQQTPASNLPPIVSNNPYFPTYTTSDDPQKRPSLKTIMPKFTCAIDEIESPGQRTVSDRSNSDGGSHNTLNQRNRPSIGITQLSSLNSDQSKGKVAGQQFSAVVSQDYLMNRTNLNTMCLTHPASSQPVNSLEGSSDDQEQSEDDPEKTNSSTYCAICNKNFARKSNLTKHISSVHRKEKPYQCPYCESKFSQKSCLKTHITGYHFRIKQHKCNSCDATFSMMGDLSRHMRTVHMKLRPYECRICLQKFGLNSQLTKHVRVVHDRIKPHGCDICGRRFAEMTTLRNHKRARHKNLLEHGPEQDQEQEKQDEETDEEQEEEPNEEQERRKKLEYMKVKEEQVKQDWRPPH